MHFIKGTVICLVFMFLAHGIDQLLGIKINGNEMIHTLTWFICGGLSWKLMDFINPDKITRQTTEKGEIK